MVHFTVLCFSVHYTSSKGFFFPFKPSHQFTVLEQLDRFDVDVMEKPFFMLRSRLSSLDRNHLHLKVSMEFGVSDIPGCINDVPKYLVLESLNYVNVALFRASPQLYGVGQHRIQYLFVQHQLSVYRQGRSSSHEPVHFLVYLSKLFAFFLTCPV